MAILTANLDTLNTAIDTLHTALEVVLATVATTGGADPSGAEELIFTEDAGQDSAAQTVKAHGTRRILAYAPTAGRPESAEHLVNSLDSMRVLFADGDFSSGDAS